MNEKKISLFTSTGLRISANVAINLTSKDSNVSILSSSEKEEALAKNLDSTSFTGSNQSIGDIKKL